MSSLLAFDDARARLLAAASEIVLAAELVSTLTASGRVLAEDLVSPVAVPPLDNSAMDGYALRCADLVTDGVAVNLSLPVSQRIVAGCVGTALQPGTAARIFTGAPVPPGADAVVMQEHCRVDGDHVIVEHPAKPGENIRRCGEDIAIGATVLTAGTRLGPAQLGVAAAVGAASVRVRRRLRVALFSTGDELMMPGEPLRPGAIYNSNRYTLYSLLDALGCVVTDLGIVPDQLAATRTVLREAAQKHDLILTSGGVSVGEEDHVKAAIEAEGELSLWKLAIKPGKPLAYGRVKVSPCDTAHFIGLPGNPVSSFVTFVMLVRPFIRAAQGLKVDALVDEPALNLRAEFDWPESSRGGKLAPRLESRREFLRARRTRDGGVELYPQQGSGVLTSCAWADGLVDNPPNTLICRGDSVRFLPFSELLR